VAQVVHVVNAVDRVVLHRHEVPAEPGQKPQQHRADIEPRALEKRVQHLKAVARVQQVVHQNDGRSKDLMVRIWFSSGE
jgi:hypothetical protein